MNRGSVTFVSTKEQIANSVRAMPLERQIGQMLMVAFPGSSLQDDLAAFIAEAGIGGVLLLGNNVDNPWQVRELTASLQQHAAAHALPRLLIAIDQEGGPVSRLRHPHTIVPSAMAIAATGQVENAYRAAGIIAAELAELGLNMNLAPVVDVNVYSGNPVIATRAYGDDPEVVSACGRAAIEAHHENGVLVAAKHFPGHGGASLDSHVALPDVMHDLDALRAVHLPPFVAAITAGVDALLTAHVCYPLIDPSGLPATLSERVLRGLLRNRLAFDGLIITDAIEMDSIARRFSQVEGAVQAVAAGADVVLTVGRLAEQRDIYTALLMAAREGRVPADHVAGAVTRVLRAKMGLRQEPSFSSHWPKHRHQLLAREIARESVTIVRDSSGSLPLRLQPAQQLGLVEFRASRRSPVEEPDVVGLLDILVRSRHGNTASALINCTWANAAQAATDFAATSDLLLIATRNAALDAAQARAVNEVLALGKPAIVVALCSPYDLQEFPRARCALATYGDQPCSLEALAGALFGDYIPSGHLPVEMRAAG